MERDNVLSEIWRKGNKFLNSVQNTIDRHDVGAELSGIGPMFFITFKKDPEKKYKERRMQFYAQLIRRGIFMHPYHHGYIAYRHTQDDLDRTVQAIDESLATL